jgi:hypothetical protein
MALSDRRKSYSVKIHQHPQSPAVPVYAVLDSPSMNSGAYLRKHRTRYCEVAGQRQRSYRGDAVLSHARAIGLRLGGIAGSAAAWRTRHSAHAEDLTVRRAVVLIYATAVAYFFTRPGTTCCWACYS